MEVLASAAVEQVALAPDGLPVAALWGALAEAAAEQGVDLGLSAVRTALWRRLTSEPGIAAALPPSGGSQGRHLQPGRDAELDSPEAAELAGVALTACRELQDAAVGLHDSQLTRFAISDSQRKALGLIGAAGRRGALQNELAAALGTENRNFFYVVKVLEQRGLVVKHPMVVKRQGGQTNHVQTNLVHLARFAPPNLGRGAKMTDGKATAHGAAPGLQPLGEDEVAVLDDASHFRRICAQLEECPGLQANESELKAVLGFRGQRGHRVWRRIKPALAKKGHIEEILARTETDKAIKLIKLLKPWKEEGSDEEGSEGEEEGGEAPQGPPVGQQVAELSIDRQLLRMLVAAGPSGVSTNDIGDRLGLNMKRNEPRMKEMEARFGVKRSAINKGRVMTSLYAAPDELLRQFRDAVAPLRPDAGWLGAVIEAIEAGLDEGEPFPWPPGERGPVMLGAGAAEGATLGQEGPQQQQQQPEQQQQQQPEEEEDEETEDEAERQQEQQAAGSRPQSALGGGEAGAAAEGVAKARTRKLAQGYTLAAERRYSHVVEALQQAGFLMASEMPQYLKERAQADGEERPTKPDRKTCDRIMARGQAEGRLQILTITFPAAKYGGLQQRSHTVLAPPGQRADEAFVEQVYQHYEAFKRRVHGANTLRSQADREEALGKDLPVVAVGTLMPRALAGGEGEEEGAGGLVHPRNMTAQLLAANGFSPHRQARLKLIHAAACRLAWLGGGPAAAHAAAALTAGQGGQVFVVTPVPGAEPGSRSKLDIKQVDLRQDAAISGRIATARDVWDALTVADFLVALGSVSTDTEMLGQLVASGRTMGQLSAEETEAACGGTAECLRAHGRLMQLLDLAHRMGLLSTVVPVGGASGRSVGATATSTYAVCSTAYLQEPPAPAAAAAAAAAQAAEGQAAEGQVAAPVAAAAAPSTATFELSTPQAFEEYWAHLQFLATRHGSGKADIAHTPLGNCFPFDRAPEASLERAYAHRGSVTADQMATLSAYLAGEDPRTLRSERCRQVAAQLQMPYTAVLAYVKELERPTQRLGRLAVDHAQKRRDRLIAAATAGLSDEPMTAIEKRRAAQRRYYARKRLQKLATQYPEGIPPGLLDVQTRAGYFGATPAGRKKAGKRKSRGSGALQQADSEESSGGEEEVWVDHSALLPQPLRQAHKKKWHSWEDRELLTAWAGFLAANGPERLLLWRVVPGRPQGLRHATLKRRLQQLERSERVGPLVQDIQGRALRVHALILQHRAAVQARFGVAPQPAAAAGAAAGTEAAAAEPGQQQQAAVGEKRKAGEDAAANGEPAAKRQRAGDGEATAEGGAAGAVDGEAAEGAAAEQGALKVLPPDADVEGALRLLGTLLPPDIARQLRKGRLPEMAALLRQLAELTEQVVAAAPKQFKKKAGQRPAGDGGAAPRRAPGPKPLAPAARKQLRPGGTQVAARPQSLLKRWAAALRGSGGRPSTPAGLAGPPGGGAAAGRPGPAVTAAMALAESLLYLGAETGVLGTGFETALTGRFAPADIWRAFELLQRQGALVPSASRARQDFQLTDRWRAQLQSLGFPPSIFGESATFAAALQQHRRIDISATAEEPAAPADALASPSAAEADQSGELRAGTVAELLGRMAAGRLVLKAHRVKTTTKLPAAVAAAEAAGSAIEQHTAELEVRIPLRAVVAAPQHAALAGGGSEGSAAGGGGGARGTAAAAAAAAAAEDMEEGGSEGCGEAPGPAAAAAGGKVGGSSQLSALKYSRQELVLFQPSLVACSADVRGLAESACRFAAAANGIGSAAFGAALAALRAAGTAGISRHRLAAALSSAGGSAAAAGQLVEQLLLHGLARSVSGFAGRRCAAAEHSQCLLAFPHIALPAAPQQGGAAAAAEDQQQAQQAQHEAQLQQWRQKMASEVTRLTEAQGLPPSGRLQPCLDVPVRPWVDHHGRLNSQLWEALARKALAAAARQPGLPEEAFLEELSVLAPQHARELLHILEAAGLLRVTALPPSSAGSGGGGGSPTSVLAACFAAAPATGSGHGGAGQVQEGGAGAGAGPASEDGEDDASDSEAAGGQQRQARQRAQRFYFVLPGACFSAARTVPPQVLLPQAAAVGDVE
ncbi:hypothetical protein C2E21_9561 [Chlorella sorokiniana]|uniref:Uncharacterized protein n=1 Tax=Chlorella sorokiniana TaxID=3076 RepID=A0A2P6TB71_CHLSO|nr:hypothetical protein C2E21_9561 [Chlorella sorokiniana]|eukprot:PRW05800.1 hypothetical protein C2E21_9561 [Chlorella sorokiniana]